MSSRYNKWLTFKEEPLKQYPLLVSRSRYDKGIKAITNNKGDRLSPEIFLCESLHFLKPLQNMLMWFSNAA